MIERPLYLDKIMPFVDTPFVKILTGVRRCGKSTILNLRFHIHGRGDCMIERPLYLDKIMPFVDTPFVKILTGVRRCGKSTILKMIIKKIKKEKNVDDEQILNYRFDSMEYEDMTTKELYLELKSKIIQSKKTYLFLDEIQEIEG